MNTDNKKTDVDNTDKKLHISDVSDSDRIRMFIDELKTHQYFYGNEMGDVGNDIGQIIHKYLTEEDNIDVFIGGLLHGISCMDGTHP